MQRWQAVGNLVPDLAGPKVEPQTSRSREKRLTAPPTGRLVGPEVTRSSLNREV